MMKKWFKVMLIMIVMTSWIFIASACNNTNSENTNNSSSQENTEITLVKKANADEEGFYYEIYRVTGLDESENSITDCYVYVMLPYAFTIDKEFCKKTFGDEITEILINTERQGSNTSIYFKNDTEITEAEYESIIK